MVGLAKITVPSGPTSATASSRCSTTEASVACCVRSAVEPRGHGLEGLAEVAEFALGRQVHGDVELAAAQAREARANDVDRPEDELREEHRDETRRRRWPPSAVRSGVCRLCSNASRMRSVEIADVNRADLVFRSVGARAARSRRTCWPPGSSSARACATGPDLQERVERFGRRQQAADLGRVAVGTIDAVRVDDRGVDDVLLVGLRGLEDREHAGVGAERDVRGFGPAARPRARVEK